MKALCLLLATLAIGCMTVGCASHAGVHTPIIDVGAGGSVGR
jgi:hypothetical protein